VSEVISSVIEAGIAFSGKEVVDIDISSGTVLVMSGKSGTGILGVGNGIPSTTAAHIPIVPSV
jgi:hypothetical protein